MGKREPHLRRVPCRKKRADVVDLETIEGGIVEIQADTDDIPTLQDDIRHEESLSAEVPSSSASFTSTQIFHGKSQNAEPVAAVIAHHSI